MKEEKLARLERYVKELKRGMEFCRREVDSVVKNMSYQDIDTYDSNYDKAVLNGVSRLLKIGYESTENDEWLNEIVK